jgi:hypothetical protein
MSSTILNVTFDCTDPGAAARFWSAVTGWTLHNEDLQASYEEYSVGPLAEGGIRLYFVSVPEPKIIKNRVHLDVLPPDGGEQHEVARLIELGASVIAQPAGAGWVILADPEGNEFCVEGGGH